MTILVIEEEWFSYTNLSDGNTFSTALIKRAPLRFNQKINSSPDTKQQIQTIAIKSFWNAQVENIFD